MSGYFRFAGTKIFHSLLVIVLAYTATFLIISVLPGDPISARLSNPDTGLSEAEVNEIVAHHGLDQPVLIQLWQALSGFVVGDFGVSLSSSIPVSQLISENLGSTLALAGSALLVAVVIALLLAAASQLLPERYGQSIVRALPSLFLSVPNFILGLILINVFAFSLGWFEIMEPETPLGTFLAALALGIPVSAQLSEVLITNLDKQAHQEYATVVRSRGTTRFLPAVTVLALTIGELLGGSVITELVFGRQGLGALIERSVASQDFPVLQAVVSLTAVIFVVANLLADLAYPLLDPRIDTPHPRRNTSSESADSSGAQNAHSKLTKEAIAS